MRHVPRVGAVWVCGILLIATPVAEARSADGSWIKSKVVHVVTRDAVVRVPLAHRATLAQELQSGFALYRTLELEAELEGELYAAATFHHLAFRYSHELRKMLNGLQIEAAACAGLGVQVGRNRYRRFRCSVTSEPLTIPTAVLVDSDSRKVPGVIEGRPRIVGPFRVRLSVRVVGQSTIAYRQIP